MYQQYQQTNSRTNGALFLLGIGITAAVVGIYTRNPETALISLVNIGIIESTIVCLLAILLLTKKESQLKLTFNLVMGANVLLLCLLIFESSSLLLTGQSCMTYKHCPFADYQVNNKEFSFHVTLDKNGYRTSTSPGTVSPPAKVPLAIIGDSMVFGWGVEEQETATAILSRELRIPVLNLGIEGASPEKYAQVARRFNSNVERFIIVYFSGNDVYEHPWNIQDSISPINDACSLKICELGFRFMGALFNTDIRGQPNPLKGLTRNPSVNETLWNESIEWNLNPYLIEGALQEPSLAKRFTIQVQSMNQNKRNSQAINDLLTPLQNKDVLFVILPANTQVNTVYQEALTQVGYTTTDAQSILCNNTLHDEIATIVQEKNKKTVVLDLLPKMCAAQNNEEFYFLLDGHLTPLGQQWVANQIQHALAESPEKQDGLVAIQ